MPKAFGGHTNLVVAALMGAAGFTLFYASLPWPWFVLVLFLGIYEGWTIVDSRPHDTISESVWRLSKSTTLVPWIFGFFTGLGVSQHYFDNPIVAISFGMLSGHFFFSRACLLTAEDKDLLADAKDERDAAAAI